MELGLYSFAEATPDSVTGQTVSPAERSRRGTLLIGSPQEVTEKILFEYELFRNQRFLIPLSVGTMPHHKIMRAIELFGTEVAPVVRREVGQSAT